MSTVLDAPILTNKRNKILVQKGGQIKQQFPVLLRHKSKGLSVELEKKKDHLTKIIKVYDVSASFHLVLIVLHNHSISANYEVNKGQSYFICDYVRNMIVVGPIADGFCKHAAVSLKYNGAPLYTRIDQFKTLGLYMCILICKCNTTLI